jgi:hypothetical protein
MSGRAATKIVTVSHTPPTLPADNQKSASSAVLAA